ncbi:rifin [Plasmodium falciparum RAJ116]|uniref:Rifin n=1 Tax=Plasmodium falciparum RAJ116 TaxID=580058 RepID=A0A0L0CU96_PLAFA|nr:rifin [Plasmodium falciparum RAJ116]
MKVLYINILLFALPLNILVYNQRNYYITPRHTQTNRSLCECELYSPANYDSDPEMKRVMQQFEDRTTQRFHEYDEKMQSKRIQCKDRCDKEIQKIILKDKLEKQMAQQLTTLETKIGTDDIPTCICEKSIADKVEKGCLRCGYGLGTVAPTVGLIGSVAIGAWKNAAIATATKYATAKGLAFGKFVGEAAGRNAVIGGLQEHFFIKELGINSLDSYFTKGYYFDIEKLAKAIYDQRNAMCGADHKLDSTICERIGKSLGTLNSDGTPGPPGPSPIEQRLKFFAGKAETTAAHVTETTTEKVTTELTTEKTGEIAATYMGYQTTIIASIIAIVVIVLIMVIIYLILRYRRKKKMKKKLQYIKLLEE